MFRGYHEFSFAHATMGHRLPTILGKAINDVIHTLNEQSGEDEIVDLTQCIARMNVLMAELSESATLRPIIDGPSNPIAILLFGMHTDLDVLDDEADVALWNKEIAKYFQGGVCGGAAFMIPDPNTLGRTFMNAPWVFAEAYKYRRLRECFSISKYWKDYDVFFRQKVRARCHFLSVELNRSTKCDTFSRSQDAVFELSMRFAEANLLPVELDEQTATEKERLMFHELTQSPSPCLLTGFSPRLADFV